MGFIPPHRWVETGFYRREGIRDETNFAGPVS